MESSPQHPHAAEQSAAKTLSPASARPKSRHPLVSQRQIIPMGFVLAVMTVGFCWAFFHFYTRLNAYDAFSTVEWKNEKNILLKTGPYWFLYDSSKLYTMKAINGEEKINLLDLAVNDSFPSSYSKAVEKLTFLSNKAGRVPFTLLLMIGGLAGIIGVHMRTLYDFVGNISYKKELDLHTWWPWYFIRPFLGFLIGGFIIVLIESNIFSTGVTSTHSNIYLVGLTILAGFGVTDVVGLLRNLSKKLFGSDRYDKDQRQTTTSTPEE